MRMIWDIDSLEYKFDGRRNLGKKKVNGESGGVYSTTQQYLTFQSSMLFISKILIVDWMCCGVFHCVFILNGDCRNRLSVQSYQYPIQQSEIVRKSAEA